MINKITEYWNKFLLETNKSSDIKYLESFYFGHNERTAKSLLELVLEGQKTATTSCMYQYILTDTKCPQVGDFSIVTDFNGNPKCIIETKSVIFLKFKDITYDICCREGEDDSLESWQENHIKFFQEIGKELGFDFSCNMDIIFEDFEVVYS